MSNQFNVGSEYRHTFTITQQQVDAFAEVSGDKNPIHLDAEFASSTRFGKRIIHGIFGASIISYVMGMHFPGPGSVYLKQNLEFKRPMFPDVTYEGVFIVKAIDDKRRATVQTNIYDKATGKICTEGEALIML
ncbi:MAG TPA: MaoC family dehydratase [Cytophagales bacterium]|nr:MaoC family dehydratase [Cytophagales bacterium]